MALADLAEKEADVDVLRQMVQLTRWNLCFHFGGLNATAPFAAARCRLACAQRR
jgi:hypothetical protein